MEQKQLNVNALNNDGFSVLDLAVLINNRPITKLLLQYGAQSGNFPVESIETHLNSLLSNSEKKLAQFVSSTGSSSQGCIGPETERQKLTIEKRIKLIRKMINGWQRLKVPDPPFSFTIGKIQHQTCCLSFKPCAAYVYNNTTVSFVFTDVIGTNSVLIKILEPIEDTICTTFRGKYQYLYCICSNIIS